MTFLRHSPFIATSSDHHCRQNQPCWYWWPALLRVQSKQLSTMSILETWNYVTYTIDPQWKLLSVWVLQISLNIFFDVIMQQTISSNIFWRNKKVKKEYCKTNNLKNIVRLKAQAKFHLKCKKYIFSWWRRSWKYF